MLKNHARRLAVGTAMLAVATPAAALDEVSDTEQAHIHVETVAEGLSHPWGLAFLPDGSALVTERRGRLRHVSADGELSEPLAGVPKVAAGGQGGLLDVALDPDFDDEPPRLSELLRAGRGRHELHRRRARPLSRGS